MGVSKIEKQGAFDRDNSTMLETCTVHRLEGDFTTSAKGNINTGVKIDHYPLAIAVTNQMDTSITQTVYSLNGVYYIGIHLAAMTDPTVPRANQSVHVIMYYF